MPDKHDDIALNILDAFRALEHILAIKKQKVVYFIDEFQEISLLKNAQAIEGAIRSFAQESKHVIFIFSGSNRQLLLNMFNDRARPLYMLCDRIQLERISAPDYINYLQHCSQITWQKSISSESVDMILKLTERHAYYVHALCGRLWNNLSNPPEIQDVENYWQDFVYEQRTEIRKELTNLGVAQLKVLLAIANDNAKEPMSHASQISLNLTSSAISNALDKLESRDYIEKREDNLWHIIDPMLKSALLYNFRV
ncbi:MAG: AAA family ATPase [Gammaproteobacteria bacterium]